MKDKILLFIPAYNCERQIVRVLNQLDNEMLSYISHIIVVNNQSTDRTEQTVIDYVQHNKYLPLTLLRNDENYNLGGSHKVAFSYAIENNFDYVVVLHGDDQGDIHDLLGLLKTKEYQLHDCCLGARFMKKSKLYGYSMLRTLANIGFNWLFSFVCGHMIYDLGSGLNIYKVDMLRTQFYLKFPDKMFFNDILVLASFEYKFKIIFFPISWKEDDQVSNVKLFKFGRSLLGMAFGYFFQRNKYLAKEMRENIIDRYTYTIIAEF